MKVEAIHGLPALLVSGWGLGNMVVLSEGRALNAFQERRVSWTLGYMCKSSRYSWLPRRSMTGSFPSGNILAPFTALGVTSEDMRELICSLRWTSIAFPDALPRHLAMTDFCKVASFLAVKAGLVVGWAFGLANWVGWGTTSWTCECCGTTFPVLWFMKCRH